MKNYKKRLGLILFVATLLVGFFSLDYQAYAAVPGNNTLLTKTYSGANTGIHPVYRQSEISDDGKVAFFGSTSSSMLASNQARLYTRNLVTGAVAPVDVSSSGVRGNSLLLNYPRSISYTGRYVVFESQSTNLIDGVTLTSGVSRLYFRDMQTQVTSLLGKSTAGVLSNGTSEASLGVSSDGRFVTFTSNATNIHPDASNGDYHLYTLDRTAGTLELLNRRVSDGVAVGSASWPFLGDMSCDGSLIVFQGAPDLDPNEYDHKVDTYLLDRRGGVDRLTNITKSSHSATFGPSISCSGDFIGFKTPADNLDATKSVPLAYMVYRPYVYDRINDTFHIVSVSASGTVSSQPVCDTTSSVGSYTAQCVRVSDSGVAVFQADDSTLTGASGIQVYIRNLYTGTTELLSRNSAGNAGNGWSEHTRITADGRKAVFASNSTNLISGVTWTGLYMSDTGL